MLRPDILQHNKEIMTEWLRQANDHECKVSAMFGVTQEGQVKFFQVKTPPDLLIKYLRHCAAMLESQL